jgi:hypothetical protein
MRERTPAGTVLPAVLVVAAVLAAGCGSASGPGSGPGGGRTLPAPVGTSSPARDCGDVTVDLTRPETVRGGICLDVGATLRVRNGPAAQAGTVTGGALAEVATGVYRGVSPGRAELGGTRRVCPDEPGGVSCLAIARWSLTVDVR